MNALGLMLRASAAAPIELSGNPLVDKNLHCSLAESITTRWAYPRCRAPAKLEWIVIFA